MSLVDVSTPSGDTVSVYAGGVAPSTSFPLTAVAASQQIVSTAVIVTGWCLYESTGAATAVFNWAHGDAAGGENAGGISLAAGGTAEHSTGNGGIDFPNGLWLNIISGSITGAVYYRRPPR